MDIIGTKFNRWKVIKIHRRRKGYLYVECICSCAKKTKKIVLFSNIKTGKSTSCGCFQKQQCSIKNRTHGLRHSAEYRSWAGMRQRCQNIKNKKYKNYGGRGIKVCKRWEKFENFYKDMGKKPMGHSIDRINNNGNYTPKNCRWACRFTQARNTSTNTFIKYNGSKKCIAEWAKILKIDPSDLSWRNKNWKNVNNILSKKDFRSVKNHK